VAAVGGERRGRQDVGVGALRVSCAALAGGRPRDVYMTHVTFFRLLPRSPVVCCTGLHCLATVAGAALAAVHVQGQRLFGSTCGERHRRCALSACLSGTIHACGYAVRLRLRCIAKGVGRRGRWMIGGPLLQTRCVSCASAPLLAWQRRARWHITCTAHKQEAQRTSRQAQRGVGLACRRARARPLPTSLAALARALLRRRMAFLMAWRRPAEAGPAFCRPCLLPALPSAGPAFWLRGGCGAPAGDRGEGGG
jgi:hypothetical protein